MSVPKISGEFWDCIALHVRRLQQLKGASVNETLLFVASDMRHARTAAISALAPLGRVAEAPAGGGRGDGFVHTETTRDFKGVASVLTDWWLLGETHLLIGTELSTFSPTAAVRTGVPLVLSSMKAKRRGAVQHKCSLKTKNTLGIEH